MTTWYTNPKASGHQGLVIDEATGRNVAVTYDKADAPLVAAAPELLAAAEEALSYIGDLSRGAVQDQLREAIAKAKGDQ